MRENSKLSIGNVREAAAKHRYKNRNKKYTEKI